MDLDPEPVLVEGLETRVKRITFKVDPYVLGRAWRRAYAQGRTLSDLVREVLQNTDLVMKALSCKDSYHTRTTSVFLYWEDYERLRELVAKTGLNQSQVLRRIVAFIAGVCDGQ